MFPAAFDHKPLNLPYGLPLNDIQTTQAPLRTVFIGESQQTMVANELQSFQAVATPPRPNFAHSGAGMTPPLQHFLAEQPDIFGTNQSTATYNYGQDPFMAASPASPLTAPSSPPSLLQSS